MVAPIEHDVPKGIDDSNTSDADWTRRGISMARRRTRRVFRGLPDSSEFAHHLIDFNADDASEMCVFRYRFLDVECVFQSTSYSYIV